MTISLGESRRRARHRRALGYAAVAIGLFGLNSIAALVTVVGVLVEVPVMLSLVWFANRTTHWFPAEETAIRAQKTREQT